MQVKVFEAPDMATGLKMIKKSLGPDALILSTKTVRKGRVGLLAKPIMEITAAIDSPEQGIQHKNVLNNQVEDTLNYESLWKDNPSPAQPAHRKKAVQPAYRDEVVSHQTYRKEEPRQIRREEHPRSASYREEYSRPAQQDHHQEAQDLDESKKLESEITELRGLVCGLTKKMSEIESPQIPKVYVAPEYCLPGAAMTGPKNQAVIELLMNRGVSMEAATIVAHALEQKLDRKVPAKREYLENNVKKHLGSLFQMQNVLPEKQASQKRLALIGPTGVGKTTTIAKLAAGYINNYHGKIGLITIDTYRIAAVEQLKVYGEIMQLPVEVVIKPDELNKALEKLADRDLIFIDTAGRSPRNESEIKEMATFLQPKYNIENHLVLSATTREQELLRSIEKFSCLPLSSFLYTKIDECEELGVLLNIHLKNDTPLSFLTNGQRVPQDILKAYPEKVANIIMENRSGREGANSES